MRQALEQRIHQEIQTIFAAGDRPHLQALPRNVLLESLENELRFLGLYSHSDQETPQVIHTILEAHLDQWRASYLVQPKHIIFHERQTPRIDIQGTTSPLVHINTIVSSGVIIEQATRYFGFLPSLLMESTMAEQSPMSESHPANPTAARAALHQLIERLSEEDATALWRLICSWHDTTG